MFDTYPIILLCCSLKFFVILISLDSFILFYPLLPWLGRGLFPVIFHLALDFHHTLRHFRHLLTNPTTLPSPRPAPHLPSKAIPALRHPRRAQAICYQFKEKAHGSFQDVNDNKTCLELFEDDDSILQNISCGPSRFQGFFFGFFNRPSWKMISIFSGLSFVLQVKGGSI